MLRSAERGVWDRVFQSLGGLWLSENGVSNKDKLERMGVNQSAEVISEIDRMLKVNNTVVDNELGGTDLGVSVDWRQVGWKSPFKWLKTGEVPLCTLRWSTAFLCEFGEFLAQSEYNWGGQKKYLEELFSSCTMSLDHLNEVTFRNNGGRLRIRTLNSDDSQRCGVYGTSMGPRASEDLCSLSEKFYKDILNREMVLQNLSSSYPIADGNARFALIELVIAILDIKRADEKSFTALPSYSQRFSGLNERVGWDLLLWQQRELPTDKSSLVHYAGLVPRFPWGHLMVPLWDVRTNWRVLQASVHVDNWVLEDLPLTYFQATQQQACMFLYTRKAVSSMDLEQIRTGYSFSGCVLEMVRTFLADWLHSRIDDANPPEWTPALPLQSIEFSTCRYQGTLRWECQCILQETIASMIRTEENMPASQYIIMLFILAFPGIRCSPVPDGMADGVIIEIPSALPQSASTSSIFQSFEVPVELSDVADRISVDQVSGTEFSFSTPFAPQDIKVVVRLIGGFDKITIAMRIVGGDGVQKFHWADWIDAAMGFMKGVDDLVSDENRFKVPEHVLNWRKRTPSKVDLSRPLLLIPKDHPKLPKLPGDIRIWTGWAPFDIKLVQFEVNQWLQAAGLLQENFEVSQQEVKDCRGELRRESIHAEEGLLKILLWYANDDKGLSSMGE